MTKAEYLQQLQQQANECAIAETNLREQIEALDAAKAEAERVNRRKHQLLGAIQVLTAQLQEETVERTAQPESESAMAKAA